MKQRPIKIFVDADFRKKLKSESALKEMSMIKYTKYLANEESLESYFKKKGYKGKVYGRGEDDPFRI